MMLTTLARRVALLYAVLADRRIEAVLLRLSLACDRLETRRCGWPSGWS
jgi:hypothetical protein